MHQHPLSAAFPSMSSADLSALTDDIAENGLRTPIIVYEGQVLDGWHRWQACAMAGVEPRLQEFDGDDPVAFVLSSNLQRRHLTASQRAAAVVACSEWRPAHRVKNSAAAADFPSAKDLAGRAEVSVRTVEHAKAAQRAGLGEAVREGKVSAERAAQVAKLPEPERAAALEAPAPKKRRMRIEEAPAEEPVEEEAPQDDEASRAADIVGEYEALLRIVEADDKLAAAWDEAKTLAAKCADWERRYDAKCAELVATQREAKRWMRRAQTLEKGGAK